MTICMQKLLYTKHTVNRFGFQNVKIPMTVSAGKFLYYIFHIHSYWESFEKYVLHKLAKEGKAANVKINFILKL